MNNQNLKSFFVVGGAATIGLFVTYGLGNALVPLLIAFGLAYLSFPLVRIVEKRKIQRSHAVLGVFGLSTLFSITFLIVVVPILIEDTKAFLSELPQASGVAIDKVEQIASSFGYNLDISRQGAKEFLIEHASEVSSGFLKSATEVLKGVFSNVIGAILALLNLFLIPLFYYYLIEEYEKILKDSSALVPHPWRAKASEYSAKINTILSGYVRGQLLVALILAILYATGLSLIGLKFGFLIGILTGLFSIIPYVGSILGFVIATAIALANFNGFHTLGGIALVFMVVQGLEGFVITPKLVGNKVGLGALPTMLALIIGGNLFGFIGMIIAIPTAAIIKAVLHDLRQEYFTLKLYKG